MSSSESSESGTITPTEDAELLESTRSSDGHFSSEQDPDSTAACRGQNEIDVVKENDLIQFSNTSDENLHEFDKKFTSLCSLEDITPEEAARIRERINKASIITVSSFDPLEGPSTRRFSSLDPPEFPSNRTDWLSNSSRGSSTSICKSHDPETEIETNDPLDSQPSTEPRLLAWLKSFLRRYSRQIRHSKYLLWFHVALFALACSAGVMSSKYHGLCKGCELLLMKVYLLGLVGVGIQTIQIAAIVSRRYLDPHLTGRELNSFLVSLFFGFAVVLIEEMVTVYSCEPVFNACLDENFCIKVFYNYAYYLNVIVLLVILAMMLIYIPGCFDPAED